MFCIFLRFSSNKGQAPQHMAEHKRWIDQGFEDEVFLATGSLAGHQGGMVLAHNTTREALKRVWRSIPLLRKTWSRPKLRR